MSKEIKLCLVYRDMWQAAGKFMPRVDQLVQVAPAIIDMGCFSRVETNGGGFEQINLLMGENPNTSVRQWTQPFNDVGIQTQMLERGLNGIRMSPVPLDVRRLMFHLKKKQGTDISRTFDGLNNPRNLEKSFEYAREGGMIAQGALSLTFSPVHNVDYYVNLANQYIEAGAQEIAVKDMAGIGRPVSIGKIVAGIRKNHPDIIIQYHGHSTPGFSVASSLEAARAGADIIDVGMEPLSWGTGHADLLTIHAMLKDAGFSLPDVNMDAYMEVRRLTQSFIDDFLGHFINTQNRKMNSLLIGPGLPGGMMGSLMADLEKNLSSLNKWLTKRDQPTLTQDQLLIKLFNEVEHVWPQLGYPPLVTPFSQYVKNTALMNVLQLEKGRERWSMLDENTWGMILGKSGQLLGDVGEKIKTLASEQNRTFFTGNPQDLYPDQLDHFREKMKEKGWEAGQDDEELFEYAMHPAQYENFKSGKAKEEFNDQLAKKRAVTAAPKSTKAPLPAAPPAPKQMTVQVGGTAYDVTISYPGETSHSTPYSPTSTTTASTPASTPVNDTKHEVTAPLEGKFYPTKDQSETAVKVGDVLEAGAVIGYIESMKVYNAITTEVGGTVSQININPGDEVEEDDVLLRIA